MLQSKLIISGVLVLAVLSTGLYISHLRSKNVEQVQQIATLTASIELQNAAVQQMRDEADAREKKYRADIAIAKEATAKARKSAVTIYKTRPSTPGDDCKSGLDLLNGAK